MVRARPSQNHGERDPHGRVQTNLSQYGGIVVPEPTGALLWTRRVSMSKARPSGLKRVDTLEGKEMVEMASEFSETRNTRGKFTCEKSETEATHVEQTVVELVSCICIFCLFASQDHEAW